MQEELPKELEDLARILAYKTFRFFPRGKYEIYDLHQEARLYALDAYRTYDPSRGAKLITFAYRVIRADLFNLLASEQALKRGGGWYDARLDDGSDYNNLLLDEASYFVDDLLDTVDAIHLVGEMNISDHIYKWGILVARGYSQWDADVMLGKKKGWGSRECIAIRSRYRKRKLLERKAAIHIKEVEARAEKITPSKVTLPKRCR